MWPYFLFAAVAILGFGLYLTGRRRDQAPDVLGSLRQQGRNRPIVIIASPEPEYSVPQAVTARGSARRIPDDMALWLIVQAGHSFYPQTKIQPHPDGTWSELAHFGWIDGSVGRTYTLYAMGADPVANGRLEAYKQEAARQDTAPLSEAKGTYQKATIYATVNVIRDLLRLYISFWIKPAAIRLFEIIGPQTSPDRQ